MKPLRTTSDFLELAARNACSKACARACQTGNHTTPVKLTFPWGHHGWMFIVWNERSTWSITIEVLEAERKYRVHSRKTV